MISPEKREKLATRIDTYVKQTLASGGGEEALLTTMYDYMEPFKQIMDSSSPSELDALCLKYDGLYKFAKLMERLASGIADGSIPVPGAKKRNKKPKQTKGFG